MNIPIENKPWLLGKVRDKLSQIQSITTIASTVLHMMHYPALSLILLFSDDRNDLNIPALTLLRILLNTSAN